jgi:hypothetical protein
MKTKAAAKVAILFIDLQCPSEPDEQARTQRHANREAMASALEIRAPLKHFIRPPVVIAVFRRMSDVRQLAKIPPADFQCLAANEQSQFDGANSFA